MIKIGFLSVAHVHAGGYLHILKAHPNVNLVGIWDDDTQRGQQASQKYETDFFSDKDALIEKCDALIITSENMKHADLIESVSQFGKAMLCEKPLAVTAQHLEQVKNALSTSSSVFMQAFPCRYSPAYQRMKQRVAQGDIGAINAICATNRGMCPFGWFIDPALSGGGAMADHVVHVADLMRDLMQSEAKTVYAQIGNNIYGQDWEDTAMLHVRFQNDVFTTIDSSWSNPKSYKTWGDVRMNVVGEKGTIEVDLFNQAFDVYQIEPSQHWQAGYGSNTDKAMIEDFLLSVKKEVPPPITLQDGIRASEIVISAYESAQINEPVHLAATKRT